MKNRVQQHVSRKPPVMRRAADAGPGSQTKTLPVQAKHNQTGLPDNLKAGIENLSGHSMDDVKVHYNSAKPASLQAHAYAQGSDIHVAPGQERHLPHEAWHVVQQKQGRVKPTKQLKQTHINDDRGLEKEADAMGRRAEQLPLSQAAAQPLQQKSIGNGVAQRVTTYVDMQYEDEWRNLSKTGQAKLERVIEDLRQMGEAKDNLNGILHIILNIDHEFGMNPASTQSLKNGTIIVNIRDWFIEASSEGQILGMLMHELGVHSLTNREMGQDLLNREELNNSRTIRFKGGRKREHKVKLTSVKNNENRQQDHVNVGKDSGHYRKMSERAKHYVQTVLTQGDVIWNDENRRSENQKLVVLRDLMETYLFDVARIMATNDTNKLSLVLGSTKVLADLFNWYKDTVLKRHGKAHPWLALLDMEQSRHSIMGRLLSVASGFTTSLLKTQFDRTRIGYGLGKMSDYISGMIIGDEDLRENQE